MEAASRATLRLASEQLNAGTMRLLRQDASNRLRLLQEHVASLDRRLAYSASSQLQSGRVQLRHFDARLNGLSPLAVLHRGYALVYDKSGGLLRSAAAAYEGQTITTRFADDSLTSRVIAKRGATASAT
jgi:exodeoxyribonuclease VII large subunit